MPSSDFRPERDLKNVFIGSFLASSIFDDNIQYPISNRVPGGLYYLGATAALQITRRRIKWNLSYQPSVNLVSQGVLNQSNQRLNQAFGTTLEVDPSQRLSFHLRQDYMDTTDPFQHLGQNALGPQISLLDRPNNSAVLPQLKRTSLLSEASVSYRLSRHTTAGVGGTYDVRRYSDVVGGSSSGFPLLNSRSPSTYLYLAHQWSRRQISGVEYRFSRFDFPDVDQRTISHSILIFDEVRLSDNNSLTLFVGPQYSQINGQFTPGLFNFHGFVPFHQHTLSPAAGLVYIFSTRRNIFQASYVRQVSAGGGLLPAVRMSSQRVSVERRLTREWTFNLAVALTDNSLLGALQPFRYRSVDASMGFNRSIRSSILVTIKYRRLRETGNAFFGVLGNHNQAALSIGYSFTKPLGR